MLHRSALYVDNLTKYVLIKFGQEHAEILDWPNLLKHGQPTKDKKLYVHYL